MRKQIKHDRHKTKCINNYIKYNELRPQLQNSTSHTGLKNMPIIKVGYEIQRHR